MALLIKDGISVIALKNKGLKILALEFIYFN